MKNLNKILFFTLLATICVMSCTKDDDKPSIVYNEFLAGDTDKTWIANSFTLAGNTQECRLDDVFTFNIDNSYHYDGGDILCGDEDDTLSRSGSWHVDNNTGQITFDRGTENEYTAEITSAENGELVITGSYFMMTVSGNYTN